MTQASQTGTKPARRRELDAMGMLVVVGLVFFHSAQIFYYADFYVKNEPPNIRKCEPARVDAFCRLCRSVGHAADVSHRRAGHLVLAPQANRRPVCARTGQTAGHPPGRGHHAPRPAHRLFRAQVRSNLQETYLQFLPRFFNVQLSFDFPRFLTGAPPDELFSTAHLWFLEYLFVFTLVLLPLWLYLRARQAAPGGSIRGFLRASVGHLFAGAAHCHHRGGARDRIHRWLESVCLHSRSSSMAS